MEEAMAEVGMDMVAAVEVSQDILVEDQVDLVNKNKK